MSNVKTKNGKSNKNNIRTKEKKRVQNSSDTKKNSNPKKVKRLDQGHDNKPVAKEIKFQSNGISSNTLETPNSKFKMKDIKRRSTKRKSTMLLKPRELESMRHSIVNMSAIKLKIEEPVDFRKIMQKKQEHEKEN